MITALLVPSRYALDRRVAKYAATAAKTCPSLLRCGLQCLQFLFVARRP